MAGLEINVSSDRTANLSESAKLSGPSIGKKAWENKSPAQWNTQNLGLRLGADATSAAIASGLVAPIVCVIDRSIVRKVAIGDTFSSCFFESLKPALTRPHLFLTSRPFFLLFSLYFATYATANGVDTLTTTIQDKPAKAVTSGPAKFVATSAVNMTLCIYKDSQFAKMFGKPSSPASSIPRLSYLLFTFRDSATIFASFNLPPMIAPRLTELPPSIKNRFSSILSTEAGRNNTAQFVIPAVMQIFSTPIHLLGLDLYNRQGTIGFSDRFARVTRDWAVSAAARMGRIIPAFGVGGVVNAKMRRDLMEKMEA